MKFNGATFNKAQQDQLKKKVGADLEDVIVKVDDLDSRMLNYTGEWVKDNEYHENDVVTWANDGHLYEVIKSHTSSATINPSNTEYYKAMTARKYVSKTYSVQTGGGRERLVQDVVAAINSNRNAQSQYPFEGTNYTVTWHATRDGSSTEGASVLGSCVVERNGKINIFTIMVSTDAREMIAYLFTLSATEGITATNIASTGVIFTGLTVMFEV